MTRPSHLKAAVSGRVFQVQGTREELLQLRSVLTLVCAEHEATDTDYERGASIGEAVPGQIIGVWEIQPDAPAGFIAPALLATLQHAPTPQPEPGGAG